MSDDDILKFVTEMEEFYGSLPSPIHEPIRFAHYIKMYRYYRERQTYDQATNTANIPNPSAG
jgi:hypothetical protein